MITKVSDTAKATADTIRSNADAGYTRWRSRGELTTDAIRAGIAQIYLDAHAQMAALQDSTTGNLDVQLRKATAAAFGVDDVAGSGSLDRASASVSYRDALDRVDAIDDPAVGARLLARAEQTGDELLARAIALHAWENRSPFGLVGGAPVDFGAAGSGWPDVLSSYLATRPKAAAAVDTLVNLQVGKGQGADLFAWVLPTPAELTGLAGFQIAALAATPATAS